MGRLPDIEHVYIAGYVSILAGRARSTEDVDVLIERIDEEAADELAVTLDEEKVWGPAIPLTSMYETLDNGDNIWIAPEDQVTPHLEVKFARDEFDRASLENAITARIGGEALTENPRRRRVLPDCSRDVVPLCSRREGSQRRGSNHSQMALRSRSLRSGESRARVRAGFRV